MNEQPQDPQTPRVPVRGIAMILLAVAVLLLAWGVYSMTNSGKQDAAPVAKPTTQSQAVAPVPASPAPATATPSASKPTTAQPQPSSAPTAQPAPVEAGQPAAPGDVTKVKVHALNNSTVQGLANRVADQLKREGFEQVESGNFPKENLPRSVAFYAPGNALEQEAAQRIANALNIKAEPRSDAVKDEPAGVVLVITEELNR